MVNQDRLNRYKDFGSKAISAFTKTGNNLGWFSNSQGAGLGTSSSGSTPWGAIAGAVKSGYNAISGHDDKDYSDLEEGIIYPTQGAAIGSAFGPVGTLVGSLYGGGYAFKDDMGMKDSNFLTQLLFPIGMGDGGGFKINGKSIINL